MAVERHLGFQAQRVARAQAARFDAEFRARLQDLVPDPHGLAGRDVDLEAVLAGVAGASDARRDADNLAVGEPVIFDAGQVDVASASAACRVARGPCTAICA